MKIPSLLDRASAADCGPLAPETQKLFGEILDAETRAKAIRPFDLTMKEAQNNPLLEPLTQLLHFNIIVKRLNTTLPLGGFTTGVLVLADRLSRNRKEAVLWAYALKQLEHEVGGMVTVAALAEAFPSGFPTQATCEEAWAAQKLSALGLRPDEEFGTNTLDNPVYWR